ncbi:MAG: hypothetical protein V2J24_17185 [Pseudomonadales bacterium]|jgi:photosystem II stability/assembly factor-like uncharacterized protein|nr:hypothetical protein [Pseudomonadales bacterium]
MIRHHTTAALAALMLSCLLAPGSNAAEDDDRAFFDGIQARNVGPFRGGRATVAEGVRQDPHTYYMGTTGGVWKTTNAGASWTVISDEDFGTSSVGAIAVAPSDPNVVFVGMGESPFRNVASSQGDGVYRSTDAGRSWTHVGLEHVRQIGEIRVHPHDPDVVWVAAQGNAYLPGDDAGIYKSTDGGASWRRVLEPENGSTGAVDLSLDASNPRILFAALWDNERTAWDLRSGGEGSGIWRSTDGGEHWERLADGLPGTMGKIGVSASPARAGLVWAVVEAEGDEGGLYRSDDGGEHWKQVNDDRLLVARSWYYMHVFADPVDADTVYVLNAPFLKSVDGGKSFSRISVPHGDNHDLWINPDDPEWMANANDGGANVSFDGGASWSRQDNQPTAQFYRVNADEQFEYRIYGGQQDNSTVAIRSRSRDGRIGRDDWEVHGGCESAHVAFDPENPRFTYAGCYLGLIEEFDTVTRTVRSVKAYEEQGLGVPPREQKLRFNWNAPIIVSRHDPSVIYHGANVLLRSDDRGFSWTEISPDLTRDEDDKQGRGSGPFTNENIEVYNTIFALEESPHDPRTIWVGSDDGLVHLTRDGGESWTEVTPPDAGRGLINSIDVSPHDDAVAYVVAMKYKEGDNRPWVWRTDDYGESWKSIAAGLPEEHFARVVREDDERPGLLFAGMERGLWLSFDSGRSWQPFQTNLPIVPVTDLIVRHDDLVLSTQGRAFWVLDDLAPLRQFRAEQRDSAAHLYAPTDAYRLTPTKGRTGGGESAAPSAPDGALLYYALGAALDLDEDGLSLEIADAATGAVLRTLETDARKGIQGGGSGAGYALPAEAGINRAVWDLRHDPLPSPGYPFLYGTSASNDAVQGHRVAPGEYLVRLRHGDDVLEAPLTVLADPAIEVDAARTVEQQALLGDINAMVSSLYERIQTLTAIRRQAELRKELAEETGDGETAEAAEALLNALSDWQSSVTTPERKTFQDVLNFPPRVDAFLVDLYQQVDDAVLGLTDGQRARFSDLETRWTEEVDRGWDVLMDEHVRPFVERGGPVLYVPDWTAPEP